MKKYPVYIYMSDNGYTGILYGKSSFIITDAKGKEVFHASTRNIETYDELKDRIEGFPAFLKMLREVGNE